MNKFEFDKWAELFKTDPNTFEIKRKQIIESAISEAPIEHRAKLRLLQLQCDAMRQSMSPLESTEKMTQMSIEKLNELRVPLENLVDSVNSLNKSLGK